MCTSYPGIVLFVKYVALVLMIDIPVGACVTAPDVVTLCREPVTLTSQVSN